MILLHDDMCVLLVLSMCCAVSAVRCGGHATSVL